MTNKELYPACLFQPTKKGLDDLKHARRHCRRCVFQSVRVFDNDGRSEMTRIKIALISGTL